MENVVTAARGSIIFFAVLGYYLVGLFFYTQVEGWKPHEALYFTTVTVTTVGYGDFSPATDEGKLFTIVFILFGLGAIGNILTGSIEVLLDRAEEAAEKAAAKARRNDFDPDSPLGDESCFGEASRFLNQHGRKIFLTIFLIVGVIVTGTVFFGLSEGVFGDFVAVCAGNNPSEQPRQSVSYGYAFNSDSCICELTNMNTNEKLDCDDARWSDDCEAAELSSVINPPFCARPFLDGLYWTVVTTFTVGYGDFGLAQKRSLIFSTFFLVVSTGVVVVAIGNFIEISIEERKAAELKAMTQEIVKSCSSEEAFNEMLREVDGPEGEGDGTIDKGEFLAHCLVKLNLVDKNECKRWLDHFKEIDEDGSGFLDSDDLAALAEKEENERIGGGQASKPDIKKPETPESAVRFSLTEEVAANREEKAAI
jgi:voltage-gated potassium channel Kch